MSSIKKARKEALERGRDTAKRAATFGRSALVAAKAGTRAAVGAGTAEAVRGWKKLSPATPKQRKRRAIAAVAAGAVALTVVGVAVARSRRRK